MKNTLIGALVSGAVLFAPVANADDASQYAGHWWSHTETVDINPDGTATETMHDGSKVSFNFRDISVVNGIAGGAGVVTSGPHAGDQAGFNVVQAAITAGCSADKGAARRVGSSAGPRQGEKGKVP